MFRFIIMSLALWRVSSLLVDEPGPWNIFRKTREHFGIVEDDEGQIIGYNTENTIGMALTCVWCTSLWIAPILYVVEKTVPQLNDMLAVSTGAIIVKDYLEQ